MNEITITQSAILKCDFDSIRERLEDQLKIYSNMVFTEEAKKDAKATVADLRKEKTSFENEVKAIKKEYMKPYEEFFEKASEISRLYDKPIAFINEQIDAFEKQRISDKKIEIDQAYADLVTDPEMIEIIPLSKIYNAKWENATFSIKQVKDEISERQLNAKEALKAIRSFNSEKEKEAIEHYKTFFDLTKCITFLTNYEAQKREILAREEERMKREAEERIRAEERAKIKAEEDQKREIEKAKADLIDSFIPVYDGGNANKYAYIIKLTDAEKEALELYMNSIGIEFDLMP